jgi:Cu(I)/Ag(I) efflux system membrane fusion protein
MLASATVDSRSLTGGGDEQALMVPASAPLVTGRRAVVYVAVPGKQGVFEGREVELGHRAGDFYIIRRGLQEGEQVVTNGAFKIDAAMQIAAKPSMMNPEAEKPAATGGGMAGMHDSPAISAGEHTRHQPAAGPAGEVPERFAAGLAGLYAAYFPLQSALAADNYEKAVQAADYFGKALAAVDMSVLSVESHEKWMPFQRDLDRARESISSAGDIAAARAGFDQISASLIAAVREFGGHGPDSLLLFHCPMAFDNRGAEWLQSHSDPHNPYYGAMMLKCKDRVETLYPAAGKDTGEQ